MKKLMITLLCVAPVTCLAMNSEDYDNCTAHIIEAKEKKVGFLERYLRSREDLASAQKDLVELQRRQTEATELLAVSQAVMSCVEIRKYYGSGVTLPGCNNIKDKFHDLVEKK